LHIPSLWIEASAPLRHGNGTCPVRKFLWTEFRRFTHDNALQVPNIPVVPLSKLCLFWPGSPSSLLLFPNSSLPHVQHHLAQFPDVCQLEQCSSSQCCSCSSRWCSCIAKTFSLGDSSPSALTSYQSCQQHRVKSVSNGKNTHPPIAIPIIARNPPNATNTIEYNDNHSFSFIVGSANTFSDPSLLLRTSHQLGSYRRLCNLVPWEFMARLSFVVAVVTRSW